MQTILLLAVEIDIGLLQLTFFGNILFMNKVDLKKNNDIFIDIIITYSN